MSGACSLIAAGIDPVCEALDKVGGVNKRVYITQLSNIASYSQDGTSKDISGFTMETDKLFYKFIGMAFRNSISYNAEVGDNVVMYNHQLVLVIFHYTSLNRIAIENLIKCKDLIAVVETNDGQMEVLGLEVLAGTTSDPAGGMKGSAAEGGSGINLNDNTAYQVTLSGQVRHMPRIFNEGTSPHTLADNITYMDALCE